jgi:6-phosphogluconolactonase
MLRTIGLVTSLVFLLVACGGGGSGPASTVTPPPPAIYTVGGTVTGLAGPGLVLNSDFGGDLAVSASGSFTFSTRLPDGSTFNVGVQNQPTSSPAQYCQVANGAGTIAAANVRNVTVTCGAGYTVGGTVSGLVGSGLTLAICTPVPEHFGVSYPPSCRRQLQVGANGAFTLDSAYPAGYSGRDYVSITQQPSSPTQHCVIGNAAVSIQTANDTSVTVSCAGFSYVANAGDNTVSAYIVDASSGALAAVGTPVGTGTSPHAIVGTQDRKYVFVGNEGSNDISAFTVNPASGALTAVPGSPFAAGTDPQAMAVVTAWLWVSNADGLVVRASAWLYVANAGSDNVSAYTIDAGTGALAPLSPGPSTIATGKNPTSIVVDGSIVFVANHGGSNDISAFSIDTGTGVLAPIAGSPFPAGGNPLSLVVAQGLYTANPDATNPTISGFSVDPISGALSRRSGSPFPLPVSHYMATDQTGAYLYVTSGASVVGYRIDATTGALTPLPGFPVSAGANAYSITVDPTNQFLYVTNDGAANVSGFTLDASTGALTPMAGSPFLAGSHPEFSATF